MCAVEGKIDKNVFGIFNCQIFPCISRFEELGDIGDNE